MLHQKTMVVDGVWSTVGTTNFDSRSFAHNEENNVCVCDARAGERARGDLRRRHQGLRAMTLKKWRNAAAAREDRCRARVAVSGTGLS